jgi:hypothetical protein
VKGLEAEVQANSIAMCWYTSLRGRRLGWAMLIQLTSGRPLVVVCPTFEMATSPFQAPSYLLSDDLV